MGRPLGRETGPSGDLQAVQYVWNIDREGESGELDAFG